MAREVQCLNRTSLCLQVVQERPAAQNGAYDRCALVRHEVLGESPHHFLGSADIKTGQEQENSFVFGRFVHVAPTFRLLPSIGMSH
jgi:hypothetical protein